MPQAISPSALRLIRTVMLGGVVLFGAVATAVAVTGPAGVDLNRDGPLASGAALLIILGALAVMVIRRKADEAEAFDQRARLLLVAYAACELAALVGAVHILLTGGVLPFVAALVLFGFAFYLLPVEQSL